MNPEPRDTWAPAYDPGAQHLPWYRRAIRQGAGYSAPSVLFVLVPIFFSLSLPPAQIAVLSLICAAIGVFFLGSTLVMHWEEWKRWLWLLGLLGAMAALFPFHETTRPTYFAAYVTSVAAMMFPLRQSRVVILVVALVAVGISAAQGDVFGIVLSLMALALGIAIAMGLEAEITRARLRESEQRTTLLAVAAERERIGRDLHDILGHSLTTIAVKADLAGRLVGRDDDAAAREVGELGSIARQALADVRATASGIRQVRLATELASAGSVLTAAGIEAVMPTALPVLDDEASELLGYVVREAVTNVVRHSGATVCRVSFEHPVLVVTDDGRGFSGRPGNGLEGLRRRVESAGGTLDIDSSAEGTRLIVTLQPVTLEEGR